MPAWEDAIKSFSPLTQRDRELDGHPSGLLGRGRSVPSRLRNMRRPNYVDSITADPAARGPMPFQMPGTLVLCRGLGAIP